MIWSHDKQWWIVRLLCIFKFLHLTTTIYDVLHDIHVILISAKRFFLYEKYFLYENKEKPLTKLIRDFFLQRPPSSSLSYPGAGANDDARSPGSGGTPGPLSQQAPASLDSSDPGKSLRYI